jgi:4-hydroxy-tetrahydrodipicolinate reductase
MLRIAIMGASGRMGRALIAAVHSDSIASLAATIVRSKSKFVGSDIGSLSGIGDTGIKAIASLEQVIDEIDVVIDFTNVHTSLEVLALCQQYNKQLVIGTTGFSASEQAQIEQAASNIAIVMSANMSIGINLCLNLLHTTASTIGKDTDIEILDLHHNKKVDSPSGTAIAMGNTIAKAMGDDLDKRAVYSRRGIIGERNKQEIGFATIRAGDIVGEHTVLFAGNGERIEISHKASSRDTFASGALAAVKWLADKKVGLFNMQDVLGLTTS